jgi:multidrug efflux pump subunit AcrA (membrane-fusion protein)
MRFPFLLASFCALAISGCHSKQTPTEAGTISVSLFKEGQGVWFSDETKKLFGLETVDVAEKTLQRRLVKTAQVYRPAREQQPAVATTMLDTVEAKELQVGQMVSLKTSLSDGLEFTGTLIRLDTQMRDAFGQTEALVEFEDRDHLCVARAFLNATFTNAQPRTVFAIPESALLRAADGACVYTVNGTYLTRTRVKTGAATDGFVEIEDGLYAGDTIAVKGVDSLWLVELSALKGGTPCCPVPKKSGAK